MNAIVLDKTEGLDRDHGMSLNFALDTKINNNNNKSYY